MKVIVRGIGNIRQVLSVELWERFSVYAMDVGTNGRAATVCRTNIARSKLRILTWGILRFFDLRSGSFKLVGYLPKGRPQIGGIFLCSIAGTDCANAPQNLE